MKRLYLFPLVAASLVAACADDPSQPEFTANRQASVAASNGRYLVDFQGNTAPAGFADKVAALGGSVEFTHQAGIGLVSGLTAEGAVALASVAGINDVMQDLEVSIAPVSAASDALAADVVPASQANPTTGVRYSFQWNMRAIDAPKAWAAGKLGDASVTVAILDTGIDYGNNDLTGLVDLSRSKSFVQMDTDTLNYYFGPGWHPVTDLNGHGTNVAAQVSSKAAVTAGVTSKTTLIGVKVLSQTGSGSFANIMNGVLYATDVGADVINMSLGVKNGFSRAGNGRSIGYINKVFNYANRNGAVVVVSAGNDASDLDHDGGTFRAYCNAANVICVSATGPTSSAGNTGPWTNVDALAVYSNFGRSAIEVAGPGGNIGGYVWSYCARHAPWPFGADAGLPKFYCAAGNRLIGMAGTSQAAPHVAGLAALMVVEHGKNKPAAIKHAIASSADDLGQPGVDAAYGKGRINVAKALGL